MRTHPTSEELYKRAVKVKVFATSGATHGTRILEPFRSYITHAEGSRKWNADGNEYIDYVAIEASCSAIGGLVAEGMVIMYDGIQLFSFFRVILKISQ